MSNVAVLTLRKQIGKHQAHVFTFRGKPVHQVNIKAWHKALKRVGIENFRWQWNGNRFSGLGLIRVYSLLPPDITKDIDILIIVRTWTFTSSDRLESE